MADVTELTRPRVLIIALAILILVDLFALLVGLGVTIEGALFMILTGLLLLNWPVAIILWRAARHRPPIRALQVMAVATTLIAIGITAYVLAVINAGLQYAIPREIALIAFRVALIGLALFPLWFLYLYLTRRFDDGETGKL